jgi:hypothetical protein
MAEEKTSQKFGEQHCIMPTFQNSVGISSTADFGADTIEAAGVRNTLPVEQTT